VSPSRTSERQELLQEIQRIVASAMASGSTLRVGYHAGLLFAAYPVAGLSIRGIIDELTAAATKAGVVVETPRPGAG
jgi:hypothetical protein